MQPIVSSTSWFSSKSAAHAGGRIALLSLAITILALAAGGCRSSASTSATRDGLTADTGKDALASPQPRLPRAEVGLEYRRFLVYGQAERLGALLAPFLSSTGQAEATTVRGLPDDSMQSTLRANGLRLIAVPMDRIDGLIRRLPVEPVHDSTWLGQVTDWMPIAEGPRISGTRILRIRGEQVPVNEGRFRLMMRVYPVTLVDQVILRLEILPQLHRVSTEALFSDPARDRMAGDLFTDIACGLNLDGSHAIVLVGESPLVDWTADDVDDTTQPTAPDQPDDTQPQHSPESDDMGPQPIPIRTIGEETLQTADGGVRMVIIFIPKIAGE